MQNAVYTVTANCQDCYRCVRACPVKAIRVKGGQAQIEDSLCIKCGTCVRECPQGAKTVWSNLEEAKRLISQSKAVAASVAPSFAAAYPGGRIGRIPSALRQLGFRYVSETAEGAKYFTGKSFMEETDGSVCTACPAVVNFIEMYKPELTDLLIPVASPMIVHGRMLKALHPGCSVIFIGPCAAKMAEAQRPENQGAVDVVITFDDLDRWLAEEGVFLENCTESSFDASFEVGYARMFPLEGAMLKTGGEDAGLDSLEVMRVSGADEVISLLGSNDVKWRYKRIEPLFCKGGCINGPALSSSMNLFERRSSVIGYAGRSFETAAPAMLEVAHEAAFLKAGIPDDDVPESKISKILERMGKSSDDSQLNCGACGYKDCIGHAKAVARGMAELDMCLPYTRRLAQQRTDRIIDTTPNGVVILDSKLCMIKFNPAFGRMFMCGNGVLGRRISYLINADGFEKLVAGNMEKYESIQVKYGIKYHEILYSLGEEHQYVGIYSDISKIKYDERQLDVVKEQTIMHAREFLDHQIRFAQEMANYLGRSAAKSEEIARQIIGLYDEGGGQ
jgi:iron only hydrogenase large subunit-like protein